MGAALQRITFDCDVLEVGGVVLEVEGLVLAVGRLVLEVPLQCGRIRPR